MFNGSPLVAQAKIFYGWVRDRIKDPDKGLIEVGPRRLFQVAADKDGAPIAIYKQARASGLTCPLIVSGPFASKS
jgi:hypothetical protein